MIVICDIDSTLANNEHRQKYLKTKPKNWKAFQSKVLLDSPIPETIALIKALAKFTKIVYVTGRTESIRAETSEWLKLNGCPRGRLLMREDGDFRPSADLKRAIVKYDLEGEHILLALDDDRVVRSTYEGLGIRTIPIVPIK
jgi:hypothetical protein